MPKFWYTTFTALSVYPRVGIARSALETIDSNYPEAAYFQYRFTCIKQAPAFSLPELSSGRAIVVTLVSASASASGLNVLIKVFK